MKWNILSENPGLFLSISNLLLLHTNKRPKNPPFGAKMGWDIQKYPMKWKILWRERSALWNLWLRTPQFSWREACVQVRKNVTPYFVKTCDIKYLLMVVFSTYSLTNDEVLCFVRYDEIWISQNFFDEIGRIADSSYPDLIFVIFSPQRFSPHRFFSTQT